MGPLGAKPTDECAAVASAPYSGGPDGQSLTVSRKGPTKSRLHVTVGEPQISITEQQPPDGSCVVGRTKTLTDATLDDPLGREVPVTIHDPRRSTHHLVQHRPSRQSAPEHASPVRYVTEPAMMTLRPRKERV